MGADVGADVGADSGIGNARTDYDLKGRDFVAPPFFSLVEQIGVSYSVNFATVHPISDFSTRMAKVSESDLQRKILDTARHLLTTDGYTKLSMRKIAKSYGYSATSIYLHFSNKDELVHALIDEGVDILFTALQEADNPALHPVTRVQRLCRTYIEFGLKRPQYYEIMYVLHPEYIKRYPAEKYRKARRILGMFASAAEAGMDRGDFDQREPMLCANLMWTQLLGVVTLLMSERVDKRISSEKLVDATCEHIVRSLVNNPMPMDV
ncbi:MAG: TetR/AcrR family transcriptional regulator [Bacteroidetes Order II. Incertae sedis bacterium]|nr:TetR/AcrR family transcriptional regulator [Bacteroidetes Order II. bacterium]